MSISFAAKKHCNFFAHASVAPPTRVLSCLKSIPFNATLRDSVMDMADSIYTLDIFQYNQLGDSNPLLNQGVDIAAECKCQNQVPTSCAL